MHWPREPAFSKLMGVCSADFHKFDGAGRRMFVNQSGCVVVDQFARNLTDCHTVMTHTHMMEQCLRIVVSTAVKASIATIYTG